MKPRVPQSTCKPVLGENSKGRFLKKQPCYSSRGSKYNWALVHMCTCKASAKRFNVYVSGKKKYFLFLRQCKGEFKGRKQKKNKIIMIIFYTDQWWEWMSSLYIPTKSPLPQIGVDWFSL